MSLIDGPRLDAHLHLWDLAVSDYAWLGPQHGPLFDTFRPDDARAELDAAGIEHAILVQAEDSLRDTEYLLELASANPWVAGVVGWIQLDDTDKAQRALERWEQHPAFCGVRHLVHDDPRDDFLALPAVRRSLALLAQRGLPFDVSDAWPRHLAQATLLAGAIPELTIVIDHLAKPPIGRAADAGRDEAPGDLAAWRAELATVAALPNTAAKISGLTTPGVPFTTDLIRPSWDAALELFGPERLLYGGDWPVTVAFGGYQAAWAVYSELIGELSPREQGLILEGSACRIYRRKSSADDELSTIRDPMSNRDLGRLPTP